MTNNKIAAATAAAPAMSTQTDEVDGRLLQEMASLRDGQAEAVINDWMQQLKQRAQQQETAAQASASTSQPEPEEEEDGYDDDMLESCSSFSLQECINEFRARRIRRISTHSREVMEECFDEQADENLIEQNRINKEQERKCKPCKNGFCYCFTSDSGDVAAAAGGGGKSSEKTRAAHMRQIRRNKNVQSTAPLPAELKQTQKLPQNKRRSSASTAFKSLQKTQQLSIKRQGQITAISSLEASTELDAPLIHIVQQLHENCVISEVRVNRQKMEAQRSGNVAKNLQKSAQFKLAANAAAPRIERLRNDCTKAEQQYAPTAPELHQLSADETAAEKLKQLTCLEQNAKSKLSSLQQQRKAAAAAVAAAQQKRYGTPPAKPPRLAATSPECQSSASSLNSSTSSVQRAEHVLDEFLRARGIAVPGEAAKHNRSFEAKRTTKSGNKKRDKRKTFPMSCKAPTPSCPSFSEMQPKVSTNYDKNISFAAQKSCSKEHYFGWQQPKISEMLNYDSNANAKQFRTQGTQAEPQQTMGWQAPQTQPHKLTLDAVDGFERHNLASNVQIKSTPVKTSGVLQTDNETPKFIWGEKLNNLKPCFKTRTDKLKHKEKCPVARSFLRNSKRKILRFVSPKKDNKERMNREIRKTPMPSRNVAVQTSADEIRPYALSSQQQSPPGSYHSAVQPVSTTASTQNSNETEINAQQQFDFARTVHSPHKKCNKKSNVLPPSSQRKLHFCAAQDNACTYRSYQADLDQETTLSKMSHILGNIRAKLEASDEHAVRTFQDVARRQRIEQQLSFDVIDAGVTMRPKLHIDRYQQQQEQHKSNHRRMAMIHEPIYSEVEEDSLHISSPTHFDSKTGFEAVRADEKPMTAQNSNAEALYAKVNKRAKSTNTTKQTQTNTTAPMAMQSANTTASGATPLAKILQESVKNVANFYTQNLPNLPDLPEPTAITDEASYTTPTPSTPLNQSFDDTVLSPTTSLNNIRMQQQHSPPKKHHNLSKSDLSLHRSEIFLENLCRSELIVQSNNDNVKRLEKVNNHQSNQHHNLPAQLSHNNDNDNDKDSMQDSDVDEVDNTYTDAADSEVSYELPLEPDSIFHTAGSNLELSSSTPPPASIHTLHQSTPKKSSETQTFTTKLFQDASSKSPLRINVTNASIDETRLPQNHSSSCPNSPSKSGNDITQNLQPKRLAASLNEICNKNKESNKHNRSEDQTFAGTLLRLKRIKDALQTSIRKSKNFVKTETKRLSHSLPFTTHAAQHKTAKDDGSSLLYDGSNFSLSKFFAMNEHSTLSEQLATAVSICRQLPDLEISTNMVEAERLLLFSNLQKEVQKQKLSLVQTRRLNWQQQRSRLFYIDEMLLPTKANPSQDIFFNYYYIVTFECDGTVKSTQSVECYNQLVNFYDCGIEFAADDETAVVNCEIFMLRLRKVSTLSLEPKKPIVKLSSKVNANSSSSSSCSEEIISRFRRQAHFTLKIDDFKPFDYVHCETQHADRICLRASKTCELPLTASSKSTNVCANITLTGRAEARFAKQTYKGFLHVQDPHTLHNWNRRWCTLNGLLLYVWRENNDISDQPIFSLDLRHSVQKAPLCAAPAELCARARSFCLQCPVNKTDELGDETAAVFFVAESQEEFDAWLLQLNAVLSFISTWL